MKAALYGRVSTDKQDPLMQKRALVKLATEKEWDYTYFEEMESTRKTRPVKNQVYLDALKGKYEIVVVWKVDRWARSVQELARDIETLFNKGVKFISITDNIDLTTASGRLQFNVICAFAQFERDIISERTKEAFYVDDKGITRSVKRNRAVGKRGKDRKTTKRTKTSYYEGWIKRKSVDKGGLDIK